MEKLNLQIRKAVVNDLIHLKGFEQEIIKFERPFDPTLKQDPITYYDLLELIHRKDAQVIVATIGEQLVGSGYALIKNAKPYNTYKQYAYLGFMYVKPNFRGKGINGKIVEM